MSAVAELSAVERFIRNELYLALHRPPTFSDYGQFEAAKRELQGLNPSPREYERAIQVLASIFNV